MTDARKETAELWDREIERWLAGQREVSEELRPWFNIYRGKGEGAPNLRGFPEPFLGDLFGRPKAAFLALNPGPVYPAFQYAPDGVFVEELQSEAYTSWAAHWRYLDEKKPRVEGGLRFHGKRLNFLRRWCSDESLGGESMLAFELYPWHSESLNAPFVFTRQALALLDRYLWQPLNESEVKYIFGVGAPWLKRFPELGLQVLGFLATPKKAQSGDHVVEFSCNRRMVVCRTTSGAVAIGMQTFGGYPAPPNPGDTEILRRALEDRGWVPE